MGVGPGYRGPGPGSRESALAEALGGGDARELVCVRGAVAAVALHDREAPFYGAALRDQGGFGEIRRALTRDRLMGVRLGIRLQQIPALPSRSRRNGTKDGGRNEDVMNLHASKERRVPKIL